ncbi:MAG: 3-isopropylmalate dehydratase small subunit [Candidatus Omnitrophota bacterium]
MEPFKIHRGIVAPLDTANVDTDQIIAKQFLKSIHRTGFGEHLFHDWRYHDDGSENPNFILNRPAFKKATILLARNNFGCGSSREHAVWAIQQYGFKAVVAPKRSAGDGSGIPAFADIFRNNSFKNGLLTVELPDQEVETIFQRIASEGALEMTVDLTRQTLILHSRSELSFSFEIDPANRTRLLEGLDDIGMTLQALPAIEAFEKRHKTRLGSSV